MLSCCSPLLVVFRIVILFFHAVAQLQDVFYPPQVVTRYAFLFVVMTAFFLMNLTVAVLWSTFASSMDSEDTAKDAKEMMKTQKELGMAEDTDQRSDDVSWGMDGAMSCCDVCMCLLRVGYCREKGGFRELFHP